MAAVDKTFLEEFIEVFRNEPALWQIKNDIYVNKFEKNKSWNKLLTKYKEFDKDATIDVIKKKVKCLRSAYRRELAKVRKSEKSGVSAEALYVPSLWYFDNLNFLRDQDPRTDGLNTFDDLDIEKELIMHKPNKHPSNKSQGIKRFQSQRLLHVPNAVMYDSEMMEVFINA